MVLLRITRGGTHGPPPPPTGRVPRLYPAAEVAELLDVHVETVRRWIRSGEIGSVNTGRRLYVRDDQLAAFIDAHTVDGDDLRPPGSRLSPAPPATPVVGA